jgi:hypothetical protein
MAKAYSGDLHRSQRGIEMTLTELGAAGEFFGGIAVILTLIYLAIQIRQNTKAVRLQTHQGLQDTLTRNYSIFMEDRSLDVIVKFANDPANLSPQENLRNTFLWRVIILAHQNLFYQVREGAIETELADGHWQFFRHIFLYPGFPELWDREKYLVSGAFQAFVESEVLTREPAPEYVPPFDTMQR